MKLQISETDHIWRLQGGYDLDLRCHVHMTVCSAGLSLCSIILILKEAVAVGSPSQHEQAAVGSRPDVQRSDSSLAALMDPSAGHIALIGEPILKGTSIEAEEA